MKLTAYFNAFLTDSVNLNPTRLDALGTRTTAITNFLKQDDVFGPLMKPLIPQGSFAQKTIIRPRADRTFDADLLVHLDPVPDWEAKEYVGKLYSALGRSPIYKDMRYRRTRCVYVDYANEFHVDLVPYVVTNGLGYITNRKTGEFELTDPKGITGWLQGQNKIAGGHLIKVIRLLKYVRDTSWGTSPKSVILTTLIGERVSNVAEIVNPGCYADVPTTLKTVVAALDDYLQANPFMPTIVDPGGTQDRFDERWDQAGYSAFRNRAHRLREKVNAAYDAPTVEASLTAWREVFGDQFKAPSQKSSTSAGRGEIIRVGGREVPATERFLGKDLGITTVAALASVTMVGTVEAKGPLTGYRLPTRGNQVSKGRRIDFRVEQCSVAPPYSVYWKIRNTGAEAKAAGSLRGEIITTGHSTRQESTLYAGEHWVECYVIKNGLCVAKARQPVNIT